MKREATLEERTSSQRIKYLIDTYCNGSQIEFAKRVGIGKSSVSQYVNGTNFPGNKRAKQIADVFYVDPMWVMGFQTEMRKGVLKEAFDVPAMEGHLKNYNKTTRDIIIQRLVDLSGDKQPLQEFVNKYERLSPEGRKKVKEYIDDLLKIYHQ